MSPSALATALRLGAGSGFFQHREHFRRLFQRFFRLVYNRRKDLDRVVGQKGGLGPGLRRLPGDGEDGPLGRLHNRLIGRLDADRERVGEVGAVRLHLAGKAFGEAAEEEGKDNPRVAPGTPQQRRRRHLGGLLDRRVAEP